MRRRRSLTLLSAMVFLTSVAAACPSCREGVAVASDAARASGYNASIYLLALLPMTLVAAGLLLVRSWRRRGSDTAADHSTTPASR